MQQHNTQDGIIIHNPGLRIFYHDGSSDYFIGSKTTNEIIWISESSTGHITTRKVSKNHFETIDPVLSKLCYKKLWSEFN